MVDALITGFHDPMASHLAMLYAIAGEDMIRSSYEEAVASGYLWHEFGDTNLIFSGRTSGRDKTERLAFSGHINEVRPRQDNRLKELIAA